MHTPMNVSFQEIQCYGIQGHLKRDNEIIGDILSNSGWEVGDLKDSHSEILRGIKPDKSLDLLIDQKVGFLMLTGLKEYNPSEAIEEVTELIGLDTCHPVGAVQSYFMTYAGAKVNHYRSALLEIRKSKFELKEYINFLNFAIFLQSSGHSENDAAMYASKRFFAKKDSTEEN